MNRFIFFVAGLTATSAFAATETFSLSIKDAERTAVNASNLLKSYTSTENAARNQADSQFENLLPKLSLQGAYEYYNYIPQITLGPAQAIPFGTHSTYAIGPVLSYTLWDGFSSRRSYQALSLLEKARKEDRDAAELQLLYSLRSAYIQVQLGLEELKLIHNSMELARAQDHDVKTRFRAGAAAHLDVVTSERSVLGYEIQFQARQAELAAALRDLFNLLGDHQVRDLSHPGPPGVPEVTLAVELEPLERLVTEMANQPVSAPGDDHPQIKSQILQSESSDLNASSASAKSYPVLQVSAGMSYLRPDIPSPPSYTQETVGATLSLPLYIGDSSRHLAAQQRSEADAARFRANQLREDLRRDFTKGRDLLASLRGQRTLADQDVAQSEEEARLYYTSYKAGKINFIDVQNANNESLQAKVSAARIDAQILNQAILLQSLSGKELP